MQGFRRAAIHLALVALLLRAFLPAGWMPGGSGDGALVMCSVGTAHETGRHDPGAPSKPDADGACAFAAAAALSPPEAASVQTPVPQVYRSYRQATRLAPETPQAHTRPAPRGPPSLI